MPVAAADPGLGLHAPDFNLPDTTGRPWRLRDVGGPRGTLIVFICNHCPYVLAVLDRIIRDARELRSFGIGTAAISANDPVQYPEDSFERMGELARQRALPFPYLFDETQAAAKAYGAACTPDFFGYDRDLVLKYRGRIDASGRNPAPADAPRELFLAMRLIAETGQTPPDQKPSMGCSIKWKAA